MWNFSGDAVNICCVWYRHRAGGRALAFHSRAATARGEDAGSRKRVEIPFRRFRH
jgi:hypothetical protein